MSRQPLICSIKMKPLNVHGKPYFLWQGVCIFLVQLLSCYVQNKAKLDPRCEKGIFVDYDKQSPAYLIYFPESKAIKRVRCVKSTDSYDNSSLTKQEDEHTELLDYISNTYNEKLKDNLNTEGEGKTRQYPT